MKFLLKSVAILLLVWPVYASEKDEQNALNSNVQLTISNSDEIQSSLNRLKAASNGLLKGFPLGNHGICTFDQDHVYITFPGTQDLEKLKPLFTKDLIQDEGLVQGNVLKWSYDQFQEFKDTLQDNIINYCADFNINLYSLKYTIEGHSLGSIFTPLTALYIDNQKNILINPDKNPEIKIINYGPVFTFDAQAAEIYDRRFKNHHMNFILKEDKIPSFSTGEFSQENLVSFLLADPTNPLAGLLSPFCLNYLNKEVPRYNFKPIGTNTELSAEHSTLYQQKVRDKNMPTDKLNSIFTLVTQFFPINAEVIAKIQESIAKIWNAHQLDVYKDAINIALSKP